MPCAKKRKKKIKEKKNENFKVRPLSLLWSQLQNHSQLVTFILEEKM